MVHKYEIAKNWLPRYTGMQPDDFGDYILLTNFTNYIDSFSETFDVEIKGQDKPMQSATNKDGLSIINFGIGSPNAALIMDLLTARNPKGVLFLGKCGGLKDTSEIGNFILPIADLLLIYLIHLRLTLYFYNFYYILFSIIAVAHS